MTIEQHVEDEIKCYLENSSPQHAFLVPFVERYHVLPLLVDWNGFFGLRSNGDIVLVMYEDGTKGMEPVEEARIRRIAISQGARKYGWVSELIPPRSRDAVDCPHCSGTGQIEIEGKVIDGVICYCGGLGWLEPQELTEMEIGSA